MKPHSLQLPLLALCLATGVASAHAIPQRHAGQHAGQPLVATNGYMLYSYDPDGTSGTSHCIALCASVWPPLIADPDAEATGDFTLTTRADGQRQWVYQRRPLYLFAGDAKPGDRDGDGVNGSWHVVP